jgi:hypothetical protein
MPSVAMPTAGDRTTLRYRRRGVPSTATMRQPDRERVNRLCRLSLLKRHYHF